MQGEVTERGSEVHVGTTAGVYSQGRFPCFTATFNFCPWAHSLKLNRRKKGLDF